ncbi:MAG: hypothetical protein ACHRHE_09220 [Tepidisphaerales bacterium]
MSIFDSVSFDTSGFILKSEERGWRIWQTADGDGVGVLYFDHPPDIKADLDCVEDVRAYYRRAFSAGGVGLVEADVIQADGCLATRTIIKKPQRPAGMSYIGSITLPFRDFSFALMVECFERGMTGARDTVVFERLLDSGTVWVDVSKRERPIQGWMRDPYDPSIQLPVMRNLADDEKYDSEFPTHPLSRVRAILRHIQPTLQLIPDLKVSPRFVFSRPQGKKPWWKIW